MSCVEEWPADAGGRIAIDLSAVRANYERLAAAVAPVRVGAVVKADAYGLGAGPIVRALADVGCRDVFVAFLREAVRLRADASASVRIHVLNGLAPGEEALCAARRILPVLNSLAQARRWRNTARAVGSALPAALQVDTGMSRLGMAPEEVTRLLTEPGFTEDVELSLLMTHLACADDPDHAANRRQLKRFRSLADRVAPGTPISIANSAASALAGAFHGDLVRAGLALFGAAPAPDLVGRLRPVVRLDARVIQVRYVAAGAGVGYGLTYTAPRRSRLATLAVGYADGWPRRLGGCGDAWFRGVRLPIVGRVSMDSMTLDVTALPPRALDEGDHVELIGPNATLEAVAAQAETIPYEILTGLGPRLRRTYDEQVEAGVQS